jgi:hypothetical protein
VRVGKWFLSSATSASVNEPRGMPFWRRLKDSWRRTSLLGTAGGKEDGVDVADDVDAWYKGFGVGGARPEPIGEGFGMSGFGSRYGEYRTTRHGEALLWRYLGV